MEAALGGLELLVSPVKALLLDALIGKGLGGTDTAQARLDLGVDCACPLLGKVGGAVHAVAPQDQQQEEQGEDHQHNKGHAPLDGEHDRHSADNGHKGNEQILRAVVGKLRHLEKVGGKAAHKLTCAVLIVEIKAQRLHMVIEVAANVRLYADAEGVTPKADNIV